MPSFIFACGFSYRMSFLKRVASGGGAGRFVVRGLALMLLSVMLYGFNSEIGSWAELSTTHALRLTQEFFKANLWEVLAIIGALQVLAFPLISRRTSIRALAFVALGLLHGLLCWSFNYDFVYGRPNWMDGYLGGAGKRAWDGGLFGLLAWTQILLAGTIAFDVVSGPDRRRRALATILLAGGLLERRITGQAAVRDFWRRLLCLTNVPRKSPVLRQESLPQFQSRRRLKISQSD